MFRTHAAIAQFVFSYLLVPTLIEFVQLLRFLDRRSDAVDTAKRSLDGAVLIEHVLRCFTDSVVSAHEVSWENLLAEKLLGFLRQLANNHVYVLHVDLTVFRNTRDEVVENSDFGLSSLGNDLYRVIYVVHGGTSHPPDLGAIIDDTRGRSRVCVESQWPRANTRRELDV